MPAGLLARSHCFVARKKENRKTYERGPVPEYQNEWKEVRVRVCSLFARGLQKGC
jgi:hypothetical protein